MLPCALGRAQRGQGNFLGPLLQPRAPLAGWGEPGAQVGVLSSSGGTFIPHQSPGVTSQQEPESSPGHREEQDGDPGSPRQEQQGEWMSLWEEWDGEGVSPSQAGGHKGGTDRSSTRPGVSSSCDPYPSLSLAGIWLVLQGGDLIQPFILLVPWESSTLTPQQFLDR